MSITRSGVAALAVVCLTLAGASAGSAVASVPGAPTITEPAGDGATLNPADVHMEATGFADPDGHAHACSDWEIRDAATSEPVWAAPCATGLERVHIHLGDGAFVGSHAGRTALLFDHAYVLRVAFRDAAGETGPAAERAFTTASAGPPGTPGGVPWRVEQRGYRVDVVATGFQLPVNVAFVPDPGPDPSDPFLYVVELYGAIKVVARDGTVSDYATGLLNFNPTGAFPGSGTQGVAGIAVDPASGDVFASMVYEDTASTEVPKPHYAKVDRFHSTDGGRTAATRTTILDMPNDPTGQSHQISNLTIGPDGRLYIHNGDGFDPVAARDLDSFRGKVLRAELNGAPVPGNPFYDAADGIGARDYVFASGFRNPFGGAWRAANGRHYSLENGPKVDRLARVVAGRDYGWDGTDTSMTLHALYNWSPATAPVNIAFVEAQTAFGSGFPERAMDHAFVTESGATYAAGPQDQGKRIVEFRPRPGGELAGPPRPFLTYDGVGRATAAGLASGPDGLYFTDLYSDLGTSPIEPGANLLRVRHVGRRTARCELDGSRLLVALRRIDRATLARTPRGGITVDRRPCAGALTGGVGRISIVGGSGAQAVRIDLGGGPLGPGARRESHGASELEVDVDLGGGHDRLAVIGGRRGDTFELIDAGVRLNRDRDADVRTDRIERIDLRGGGGRDSLRGNRAGNLIRGGAGDDSLVGAAGDDVLDGGGGGDAFRGGAGRDRCRAQPGEPARSCEA